MLPSMLHCTLHNKLNILHKYIYFFTVAPYNPYYSPEEFTYQQEDSIDTSIDSQEQFLG